MSNEHPPQVINWKNAPTTELDGGGQWMATVQKLTPSMTPRGGTLGVNRVTIPPGHSGVPFHAHLRDDEAFIVLAGRGIFRYGDEPLREVGPGDCMSCPAGTGKAHQLANPFDEDFVYLAIGTRDPHEICTYPDTGKVLVRGLGKVGRLTETEYMDGEPAMPAILSLHDQSD